MPTPAADNPAVPAMPYVVASWLGFSIEHIVEGLHRGSIAPPAGAPPDWLPPGAESAGEGEDTPGYAPLEDAPEGEPAPAIDLRAAYAGLVHAVDPDADDVTFEALWMSAGADDAARAASVDAMLWRAAGVPRPDGLGTNGAGVEALAAALAGDATRGTLVDLAVEGSAALAGRARTDRAALGALASLDPFAFVARTDEVTGPARFDPMTGEALVSDAWIDDRAKFVAWRAALAGDAAADDGVATGWRFVDRTLGDAATLEVGASGDDVNQVVFARDGGDAIEGGASVDRLHGGGGDDDLAGGGGDDLIEGARGDDTLAGGEGDDRLEGGPGSDRYLFASGDGVDVVDDVDGQGEIVLDGERLDGSEVGVGYALHDDGAGGTTLVIRTGTDGGEIRVQHWRDGMLGLHIGDDVAEANERAAPGSPSEGSGRQTKPLLHDVGDDVAAEPDVGEDAYAPGREDGNESGSGLASSASPGQRERGEDVPVAPPVVGYETWTRLLQGVPGRPTDDAAAPPDVEAGAVTVADVASAIAGSSGDDDAGDGIAADRLGSWLQPDDLPPGIVPPDAAPRHR